MYVFYRSRSDNVIRYSTSTNGASWSLPSPVTFAGAPSLSLTGPSTVVHNNMLYVFYSYKINGSQRIIYRKSTDGISWSQHYVICNDLGNCAAYYNTDKAVSALIHQGSLFVIYKQAGSSQIHAVKMDEPCTNCWLNVRAVGNTDQRPSAISDGEKIMFTYKNNSSTKIYYGYSYNGFSWYGGAAAIGRTEDAPFMVLGSGL
jgi:hypothetical protein